MISQISQKKLFFQKIKRKLTPYSNILRKFLILFFIVITIFLLSILIKPVKNLFFNILRGPAMVSTFFSNPLYTLPSRNGVTYALFLGMGGETHEGALLTDTMILFALDLKNNSVTMLSIPRDIWIDSLQAKINTAYYYGEERQIGGGYPLVEDAVYEIIGEPIHYIVSLDFNSFTEIIDVIGGIDVDVEKTFTDEWYPIKGKENDLCNGDLEYKCRYETVTFQKGMQHMDGQTALKFSRSRYSEGEDGTDFARSQRQQKIISAIKDKVISSETFLNPKKLLDLKQLASKYIKTNKKISDKEYAALASFSYNFYRSEKPIKTITLDTGTDDNPGFLINPPISKYDQWVLEPRKGDWLEFQNYFIKKIEQNY